VAIVASGRPSPIRIASHLRTYRIVRWTYEARFSRARSSNAVLSRDPSRGLPRLSEPLDPVVRAGASGSRSFTNVSNRPAILPVAVRDLGPPRSEERRVGR